MAFFLYTYDSATGKPKISSVDSAGIVLQTQVDNSSLEWHTTGSYLQVKSAGITNDMLAGSIADGKLASDYIQTSEVDGSSIEFAGGSLNIKTSGVTDGMLANDYIQTSEVDGSSIEFNGGTLNVKDAGITNAMLAGSIADGKLASDYVQTSEFDESSIEWNTTGSYAQVKAGGITDAMLAGSISFTKLADSANIARLDQTETVAAVWNFGTNLPTVTADPTSNDQLVRKSYADGLVSGLSWKTGVEVFRLVGERTITEINAMSPALGDAVIVEDAGTPTAGTSDALAAGDIAEYNGTEWKKIVSNSGGRVPVGTRAVLTSGTALLAPFADATDEGRIVTAVASSGTFSGTVSDWNDTGDAVNKAAILVQDLEHISIYDNLGYVFEGTVPTGEWIQFTGAGQINAGAGLLKTGNTIDVNFGAGIVQLPTDEVGVDISSDGGLELTSELTGGQLQVKLDGTSLTKGASGLAINTSGVTDGMLANDYVQTSEVDNSSIEWHTTGSYIQVKAGGITSDMLAGSIADGKLSSDYVQTSEVDNSTIEWSGTALRIKDSGVTDAKLASDYIQTSEVDDSTIMWNTTGSYIELKDDGITAAKLGSVVTANEGLKQNATTGALEVDYDDDTIGIVNNKIAVKNSSTLVDTFTNNTGAEIPINTLVALSTTVAGEIVLANASDADLANGFGVTQAAIADGASGKVAFAGDVTVVTDGTDFDFGKWVYTAPTANAGKVTKTAPSGSDYRFKMGVATGTNTFLIQPQWIG